MDADETNTARGMLRRLAEAEAKTGQTLGDMTVTIAMVHLMRLRGAGILGGDLMKALSDLRVRVDTRGQSAADLLASVEAMCERDTCPRCGAPRERLTGEDYGWYHLDPWSPMGTLRRCITDADRRQETP